MKRRLDIELNDLSEAGEILADYLNEDYDITYIEENPEGIEIEEGEKLEFDAYFIWESWDTEKGELILWTKWYNIGELWSKKINFEDYLLANNYYNYGKISSKDIIKLEKEIIEELEKYNDELMKYGAFIDIRKRGTYGRK